MCFFLLVLAVVFPAVASAHPMLCPDAKEQQAMLDVEALAQTRYRTP
jgi:hypothetical protein